MGLLQQFWKRPASSRASQEQCLGWEESRGQNRVEGGLCMKMCEQQALRVEGPPNIPYAMGVKLKHNRNQQTTTVWDKHCFNSVRYIPATGMEGSCQHPLQAGSPHQQHLIVLAGTATPMH